jgi:hypothetical protein
MKGFLLGIGQPHAVLVKVRYKHDRLIPAAFRNVEIVQRVVGAAEDIGHNLLEELAAKVEGGGEGVVAVAATADAVARFEHNGSHPE